MWSKLLTDLLEKIVTSETLAVQDISSFASVCQPWRSAVATAKHRRRHNPWLLFVDKEDPNTAKFLDLSKNKIVSIPNQPSPSFANRLFIGSANGWLITADKKSELSLLNPLTRQQIDLPPVTTISNYVLPCDTSSDGTITAYYLKLRSDQLIKLRPDRLPYCLVERAALLMAEDSADYLVVIYIKCSSDLAVARSGDKKWTVVNASIRIADIASHDDGKIYSTDYKGQVNSFVFHTQEQENLSLVKPELVFHKELKPGKLKHLHYILQSPLGELLLVRREKNDGRDGQGVFGAQPDDCMHTVKIKVWRIDCIDGHASESNKLVRLRSLGDYAIFLGRHMSFSISSKDYPELRGNCVYLSDEFYGINRSSKRRRDVGIFDLKDGSFEPILPHGAELYWPSPIWFMPTFA